MTLPIENLLLELQFFWIEFFFNSYHWKQKNHTERIRGPQKRRDGLLHSTTRLLRNLQQGGSERKPLRATRTQLRRRLRRPAHSWPAGPHTTGVRVIYGKSVPDFFLNLLREIGHGGKYNSISYTICILYGRKETCLYKRYRTFYLNTNRRVFPGLTGLNCARVREVWSLWR